MIKVGKILRVTIIILASMIVAIFVSIVGFKKGREAAAKRNIALFNIQYTQEEIKEDLDLFSSIQVDLSVSDLIINSTNEAKASISYTDFSTDKKKVHQTIITNTEGLLTIKDKRLSTKFNVNSPPKSQMILNIPSNLTIADLSLNINVGNVTITNQLIENADLKSDVGDITLLNVASNDIKINCNVGNVKIDSQESQDNFSYNLNADVGHITINGQSSSSLSNSLSLENDTAKSHLQISTSIGDIDINFNN